MKGALKNSNNGNNSNNNIGSNKKNAKFNKDLIHKQKRKESFKFQKEVQKKLKSGKKSQTEEDEKDEEDEEPVTNRTNNEDNNEVDAGEEIEDDSFPQQQTMEESSSEESDDDDDSEIFDPAIQRYEDKLSQSTASHPPLLIILDLASLETVKTKKGDFQLLNCDDHISLIRKFHKDPSEYRPDIIHQELMTVLDSPLNKANKCKILVHTEKNVLFEVSNKTRIPRTFKRFSGLMVQLLHRLKIRSADGRDMLMKVVKNPISKHIPAGSRIIGFSDQGSFQTPMEFAKTLPVVKSNTTSTPIVLIFGAQATKGILKEDHPYVSLLSAFTRFPFKNMSSFLFSLDSRNDIHFQSWFKWSCSNKSSLRCNRNSLVN